ncbi:MAG: hypothetical protein A2V88_04765 [Elusimicrobia bacterium RBG_16_66_12]|nr:MAG: hypothetical protein A2V88_04765 [Elusimicrobia bacterium RBG_16_66_12]
MIRLLLELGRVEEAVRYGVKALSPLQGDPKQVETVGRLFRDHGLTEEASRCSFRAQELKTLALQPVARPELIAIGDVHGEISGLKAVLRHAGATDAKGCWIGRRLVVVQVGDVIDRGPRSLAAWELLARLQSQACENAESECRVVRLLGNHELELLKGNYHLTTLPLKKARLFAARLREEILSGSVSGAFQTGTEIAGEPVLFTHAGLRSSLRRQLSEEDPETALADQINALLRRAVEIGDFTHPMFQAGASRGGSRPVGGLFWEDARELFASADAGKIRQVFGHSVRTSITQSPDGRLIDIDAGLSRYYGGRRTYLRIRNGIPQAVSL